MYLKEIGRVNLLSAQKRNRISHDIEQGDERAKSKI